MDKRKLNISKRKSSPLSSNSIKICFEDPLECSGYIEDGSVEDYMSSPVCERSVLNKKRKQDSDKDCNEHSKFSRNCSNKRIDVSNRTEANSRSDVPEDSILSLFSTYAPNVTSNQFYLESSIRDTRSRSGKNNEKLRDIDDLSNSSSQNLGKLKILNKNLVNKKQTLNLKSNNTLLEICPNKKSNTENVVNVSKIIENKKNKRNLEISQKSFMSIDGGQSVKPTNSNSLNGNLKINTNTNSNSMKCKKLLNKRNRNSKKNVRITRSQNKNITNNGKNSKIYDSFSTICLTPMESSNNLTDSSVPDEVNSTLHNKTLKLFEPLFTPSNKKRLNGRDLNKKIRDAIQIIDNDLNSKNLQNDLKNNMKITNYINNKSVSIYSEILKGLIIYVDVWCGSDNCSKCVEYELRQMGSQIAPCMNRDVTHLVFKEGSIVNYENALKYNIPVVSVHWVDVCKNLRVKVPEEEFPAISFYNGETRKKTYQYKEITTKKIIRVIKEVNSPNASKGITVIKHNVNLEKSFESQTCLTINSESNNEKFNILKDTNENLESHERSKNVKNYKTKKKQNNRSKMKINSKKDLQQKDFSSNDQTVLNNCFEKHKRNQNNDTFKVNTKKANTLLKRNELVSKTGKKNLNKEEDSNICKSVQGKSDFILSVLDNTENPPVSIIQKQDSTIFGNFSNQTKLTESISSNANSNSETLLITGLSLDEQQTVIRVVRKLKRFQIVKCIHNNTTHLISSGKRTINVLLAMAQDCWILSLDWILQSERNGSWLPEKQFVLTNHFPAAKVTEKPSSITKTILHHFGHFFIGSNCSVPKFMLEKLIYLYGGKVFVFIL
ncbi:microcephalin-like isoform X2 [Centruroides sculpturatus]|uniref:microcephalin-like isoform X2 n=1 Tax=Centruroides sculpturatus TaxID=218467 RepID=UPI000C6D1C2D|nr:microcephalin-like isoform X2 [Centruroides sculpturatus]